MPVKKNGFTDEVFIAIDITVSLLINTLVLAELKVIKQGNSAQ